MKSGAKSRERVVLIVLVLLAVSSVVYGATSRISFLFAVNGFRGGTKFNKVVDLAVDDAHNLVLVCDAGDGRIYAFNRQGIPKFEIGKAELIESPVAIAVNRAGNLYVAESGPSTTLRVADGDDAGPSTTLTLRLPLRVATGHYKIKVLDRTNTLVRVIDVRDEAGEDTVIGRMTVGRDDDLYATDTYNQRVLVFDKEGKLRLKFGTSGASRGQFQSIEDIAVDRQNRVYVSDSTGTPVQVFDRTGKFIYRFGTRGPLDEDFVQPSGMTIDRFDQLWVVDSAAHKVRLFDRLGFFLTTFGDYGMGEGSFFYPFRIKLDNLGRAYVLESGLRRLQVFMIDRFSEPFERG